MRIWLMLVLVLVSGVACGQEEARQIFDDYFRQNRPKDAATATTPPQQKREYRPVTASKGGAPKGATTPKKSAAANRGRALGVTVWKMDQTAARDGARLLVQAGGKKERLTPHRMEAGEMLRVGDTVRLAIETPAEGYLYVVDQEVGSGGKLGPPYLIFPTTRTRKGDNHVIPGQLVEIPAQTDDSNVFEITPKGANDEGEHLTIILSPAPIAGISLSPDAQEIPRETFGKWVVQYGSEYTHFELQGGKGRAWTAAEQQAGLDGKRLLTQNDPAPQTVFVFPENAGKPVMASIRLQVVKP